MRVKLAVAVTVRRRANNKRRGRLELYTRSHIKRRKVMVSCWNSESSNFKSCSICNNKNKVVTSHLVKEVLFQVVQLVA